MTTRRDGHWASSAFEELPFYNGRPVTISPIGWLAIVSAVPIAFFILSASGSLELTGAPAILSALLFAGLPLVALATAAGRHWQAVFRPYGLRGFGWSVLFALATLMLSSMLAFALHSIAPMQANPIMETLARMGSGETLIFLVRTFIQLFGEELVTVLPLLSILWFAHSRLGLSRRSALVIAIGLSTAWFSAMHLPTYDWNLIQCFGIIGSSRLVLTAAYILTRNLWVSTGAHVLNDWSLFALSLVIPHLAGST